jgi:subtilisin-like proprotein convertase family protein
MLQANPLLGYRDVQEILAYSARFTDPAGGGWQTNGAGDWNGGGLHVSHAYGFGLLDAHAAVRLAETWVGQRTEANLLQVEDSAAPAAAIPDNDAAGVASQITIADELRIEHVEVDLQLTHDFIGDLVVTLTSPSGATSVLVDRPGVGILDAAGSSQDDINFVFGSVQHWGESAAGTWMLRVQDLGTGGTGTFDSWTLRFTGDDGDIDTYVYTDDFAALGAGRDTLIDADGGVDILNAAAVTSGTMIDLPSGLAVIAGRSVTLGGALERIYTGDGNDTVIGSAAVDQIATGRGNDVLLGGFGDDSLNGGAGVDTIYGGPGNDSFTVDGNGDVLWELPGQGSDSVNATGSFALAANLEILKLLGHAAINGVGNALANTIGGNLGVNVLSGGAGNDSVNGGLGADTLIGGAGKDLLTGSGGLDRFNFTALSESGVTFAQRDVINTFAHGDKIDLSAIDANSTAAGNQSFSFVASFTGAAGQLQWDQTTPTAFLIWGDVNGDGGADFSLQIYGAPGVTQVYAWDFIL